MRFYSIFILSAILLCTTYTFASIRNVPGNYSTIELAAANSYAGDTVLLAPGVYQEQLFLIEKNLTIASEYILTGDYTFVVETIWTLPDSIRDNDTISRNLLGIFSCTKVNLIGINFISGYGYRIDYPSGLHTFEGGAIYSDQSNVSLAYCNINRSHSRLGGGLMMRNGNFNLTKVVIDSCEGCNGAGAVYLEGDSIRIENCEFTKNHSSLYNGAFQVHANHFGVFQNNLVMESWTPQLISGGTLVGFQNVSDNRFLRNSGAYWGCLELDDLGDTTWVMHNEFSDNESSGVDVDMGMIPGGAGLIIESQITSVWYIEDNVFRANVIHSNRPEGALSVDQGVYFLRRNRFERNVAQSGSAIHLRMNVTLTCDSNMFLGNCGMGAITAYSNSSIRINENDFIGNNPMAIGLTEYSNNCNIQAERNYWGSTDGPRPYGCGDSIRSGITYIPALNTPVFPENLVVTESATETVNYFAMVTVSPNPGNSTQHIIVTPTNPMKSTRITIYDISGRLVKELYRGEVNEEKRFEWKGGLSSGTYFVEVRDGMKKASIAKFSVVR